MISVCINTAALAPYAENALTSGGVPCSWRAYALRTWILPRYVTDSYIDEVIVTGSWEEGEGYTYVHVPPVHFSWKDCLAMRQAGFEASSGDVLIFQHDDHVLSPEPDPFSIVGGIYTAICGADVLSPARYTRARTFKGERLNGGEAEGYINGHCAIYRSEVIERCPWKDVPVQFTLDVEHTKQIKAAGFNVVHTDTVRVWDVEHGSSPWL